MSEKRPKVRSDVFPRRQSNWSLLWKIYHFSPLLCSFCMKCSLGISNFLKEISSLSHSFVFLYFFALIAEEGFLISSYHSLELCIQMLISFLFSFAFRLSHFPVWYLIFPGSAAQHIFQSPHQSEVRLSSCYKVLRSLQSKVRSGPPWAQR